MRGKGGAAHMTLNDLPVGKSTRIVSITGGGALRRHLLEERFAMIQRQLLRHADTEGTETARTTPASPPAEERSEGQTWARLEGI